MAVYIGVDLHVRTETVSWMNTADGEIHRHTLDHSRDDLRAFYAQFTAPCTGSSGSRLCPERRLCHPAAAVPGSAGHLAGADRGRRTGAGAAWACRPRWQWCTRWRIWTYVGDDEHPYTVYDYTPNRSRDGPHAFLKEFSGFLQADAYSGYDELYEDPERDVTEVACWAHARRKFYEAQSSDLMRSMVMLAYRHIGR